MLLVDRIIEMEPGKSCKGIKNVSANEMFFTGHYPGLPVMPGVLILEAISQTGAILILTEPEYLGCTPLLGAIDDVKFRRMVVPGDQLVCDVQLIWIKNRIGKFKGTASVDGEIAATMTGTFKIMDKESA